MDGKYGTMLLEGFYTYYRNVIIVSETMNVINFETRNVGTFPVPGSAETSFEA
jgi:hypothetical protein